MGISSSYQCGRIKPGNIPFFPCQSPWAHRGPRSHPYFTATTHHESGIHFPRLVTEGPSDDLYQHHHSGNRCCQSLPLLHGGIHGDTGELKSHPILLQPGTLGQHSSSTWVGSTGPEKRVTRPPRPSSCFTRGWPEGKTKRDRRRGC